MLIFSSETACLERAFIDPVKQLSSFQFVTGNWFLCWSYTILSFFQRLSLLTSMTIILSPDFLQAGDLSHHGFWQRLFFRLLSGFFGERETLQVFSLPEIGFQDTIYGTSCMQRWQEKTFCLEFQLQTIVNHYLHFPRSIHSQPEWYKKLLKLIASMLLYQSSSHPRVHFWFDIAACLMFQGRCAISHVPGGHMISDLGLRNQSLHSPVHWVAQSPCTNGQPWFARGCNRYEPPKLGWGPVLYFSTIFIFFSGSLHLPGGV